MGKRLLRLEIADQSEIAPAEDYSDFTVFQTSAWLRFLEHTQGGKAVFAKILADNQVVGRIAGIRFEKHGLTLFGSPAPGWTTGYMGFNLEPDVERREALAALKRDAFRIFRCAHFEINDRRLNPDDAESLGLEWDRTCGFEVDLTRSEDQVFAAMTSACRRCIRRAEKLGVVIEQASDDAFAEDYYEQLKDVFAKQGLVPTYPQARIKALIEHLLPSGRLLLLRARDPSGRCIATGVFPAANDFMYFWGGASFRSGQHYRPNEALQWAAMQYWKKKGIAVYDMGGGGDYKKKYGGREITGAWMRHSRYPFLGFARSSLRYVNQVNQRLRGLAEIHRVKPPGSS